MRTVTWLLLLSLNVAFGVLIGCIAWLTARGIYWFEDLFDRTPGDADCDDPTDRTRHSICTCALAKPFIGELKNLSHLYFKISCSRPTGDDR